MENLALSCPMCNARKWIHTSAEDPVAQQIVPLFNPRTDAWNNHFRWAADDPCQVEPLSAVGRATASLLDLNSHHRQTIRRWLVEIGAHPPVSSARK
jgi:hypothetical protein